MRPIRFSILLFSLFFLLTPQSVNMIEINVGGLFPDNIHKMQVEIAFDYGIKYVNEKILKPYNIVLNGIKNYSKPLDLLSATNQACWQITNGAVAIFGPFYSNLNQAIGLYCTDLGNGVTHFQASDDHQSHHLDSDKSFKMHPSHSDLNKIALQAIEFLSWKKISIIYDDFDHIEHLVLTANLNRIHITSHRLKYRSNFDEMLADAVYIMNQIKTYRHYSIFISCQDDCLIATLLAAKKTGLLSAKYDYLTTNLDTKKIVKELALHSLGLGNIKNIIVSYLDALPDRKVTENQILELWNTTNEANNSTARVPFGLRLDAMLAFDGILTLSKALIEVANDTSFLDALESRPTTCEKYGMQANWTGYTTLIESIQKQRITGMTGPIYFDKENKRQRFQFLFGTESLNDGKVTILATINSSDYQMQWKSEALQKTLIVTTLLSKPFVMKNPKATDEDNLYHGFCIDLLKEIARRLDFKYVIHVESDMIYGVKKNGTWNGLIGELVEKKADLAFADLTITAEREEVVEFTKPYLNMDATALLKKKNIDEVNRVFAFTRPFSMNVWISIIISAFIVALYLWLIGRFSPYDWYFDPPPSSTGDESNFSNSLWFVVGAFMQQGTENTPRSMSCRTIGFFWWLFVLVIISSYTANLAAFMTHSQITTEIQTLKELAHSSITYGTVRDSQLHEYFKYAELHTYEDMWLKMKANLSNALVETSIEGVEKVQNSTYPYGFIWDTPYLEYVVNHKDCNLFYLRETFDSKGYGIALQSGSIWYQAISSQVLKLAEEGFIQERYDFWWRNGTKCKPADSLATAGSDNSENGRLTWLDASGTFYLLIIGVVVSLLVLLAELFWDRKGKYQARLLAIRHTVHKKSRTLTTTLRRFGNDAGD